MEEFNKIRSLLLVDDEENILSSLTRLLRREGYTIFRATSGQEGIEVLKEHTIGVIVSDQRMPEMTGVEFLSKVKVTHPDTIRIVLSGYTDLKSITDAINQGAVYKFLTKPWDDELLKKNIVEAFERYEMKLENKYLNDELKAAYASLEQVNKALNKNVEIKTDEAALNKRVLNVAQEVLENMPAGILGIGSDGVVAVTNKLSEKWIGNGSGPVIGSMAKNSLPNAIFDLYTKFLESNEEQSETISISDSLNLEVRCSKLGKSSSSDGSVLVLTKTL